MLSEAEAQDAKKISDVSYVKARQKQDIFNYTRGLVELRMFRIERVRINQALKNRSLLVDERDLLPRQ
jgi:hypothetical protein